MESQFVISQSDGRPMYLQIMEQIKRKIAVGDWPAGYKLPSIREFAVALKVSVITVKRAYQDLETEGVIMTQHGKGSYVAERENIGRKMKQEELDRYLIKVLNTATLLGMDVKDITSRLHELKHAQEGSEGGIHDN